LKVSPTIRKDGSELWFTWNPDQPNDAVEKLFAEDPDAVVVHVNYYDNPLCPEVMKKEAEKMKKRDYEKYVHIWLGGFNTKSESQIFMGKWKVDEFEPVSNWSGPYHGLDFGFANDPTAGVKLWIYSNILYIEMEAGKVGLELDDTAKYLKKEIPGIEKYVVRADNARPESISYLRRHGLKKIVAVKKGKGSVEDGIEFIKSFDSIVIHSRCKEMQEEARLYSYKVDKKSGDILPEIEDKDNHYWDAVRYALEPLMKNSNYEELLKKSMGG
jgi:phage terminase large subunit